MKARIIGTIIVLAILGCVAYAFNDSPTAAPQQQMQYVAPGESSYKDLKIN